MTTTPLNRVLRLLSQNDRCPPTPNGDGWQTRCPAHDDQGLDLRIFAGDDGRVALECNAGCKREAILAALNLSPADLAPRGAPVLVRMSDVQAESVQWLWPNRIGLGKLTMLMGDPGVSKSFLTLDLAARVSAGISWPDQGDVLNPAGSVVILSAEDDLADTIRPRLDAAGANVERISALTAVHAANPKNGKPSEVHFSLETDLAALEQAVKDTVEKCRLIIIDPITAYLGKTDSHKNAEIRGLLAPLAELAARHDVAVVAVTHLNKSTSMTAMYRAMGSLAFVAAARAVWLVARDKNDLKGQRRLLLPIKNNIGNDKSGLAYSLVAAGSTACVAWEPEPISVDADDALAFVPRRGGGNPEALNEAVLWLKDFLAGGPKAAKEVKAQAESDGIKARTMERAKKKLKVQAFREGFGKDGKWVWALPDESSSKAASDPTEESLAVFDDDGGLCGNPDENGDFSDESAERPPTVMGDDQ